MMKYSLAIFCMMAATPSLAQSSTEGAGALVSQSWSGIYGGLSVGHSKMEDPLGGSGMVAMQAGYMHQLGAVVLGVEVAGSPIGNSFSDQIDGEMKSWWALKGRVGYDAGLVQPYATIGIKFMDAEYESNDYSDKGVQYGLGADFAVDPSIILGALVTRTTIDDFDGVGFDYEETNISIRASVRF